MSVATAWPKIDFTDERLDNGLRLIMSVDRLAPIAAVNIWYRVGSRNEVQGRTGFAHLFEHMMFEGSAHVDKGEHFKLISNSGGTLNGQTQFTFTRYYESAPSHHLELLLWLEADRMGGLLEAVKQETLDNQRDVVKNERLWAVDNRPYGDWLERVQHALFPQDHPYHHEVYGSLEDLSAATLEDVHDFFRTYYVPNNATLSLVGDFDPQKARKWVAKYFGVIPSTEVPPPPSSAIQFSLGAEKREVVTDQVPLPRIYTAYRAPGDGTRADEVLTMGGAVLSFGKGSRLHRRLVKDRQLAQDVQFFTYSQLDTSMTIGWATARTGVSVDELDAAFIEVINSLAEEPITDDELARSRAQIERLYTDHLMTVSARADWLSEHATLYDDPGRANERLPSLMSVSAKEIKDVASEILTDDNRAVITYIPGEKKED